MLIFQIKRIISSEKCCNYIVTFFSFENAKNLGWSDDGKWRKKRGWANIKKNKKTKQNNKKKERKKESFKKIGIKARNFHLVWYLLTTTLLRMNRLVWGKAFDLRPFPWNFCWQMSFKADQAVSNTSSKICFRKIIQLLTVKNEFTNAFHVELFKRPQRVFMRLPCYSSPLFL